MAFPVPFTTRILGTKVLATVSGSSQMILNICLFFSVEPLQKNQTKHGMKAQLLSGQVQFQMQISDLQRTLSSDADHCIKTL
jgi:hypothetical protein